MINIAVLQISRDQLCTLGTVVPTSTFITSAELSQLKLELLNVVTNIHDKRSTCRMVRLSSFLLCEVRCQPLPSCVFGEQLGVWGRLRVARQNQLLLIDLGNPDVDKFTFRVLPQVLIGGHPFLNFSLLFPIWETYFMRNSPPLSNPFRMKA